MQHEMRMPDLATTGSAMKIVRWLKQPGQPVQRGEFLLEVETDKAAMEVEATVTGTLRETRVGPGDEVTAGDLVAILEAEGAPATAIPAAPASPAAPVAPAAPAAAVPAKGGGLFARNRAAAASPARSLSPARRTAARRLQESKQTVPHFYVQTSANAALLQARRDAAGPARPVWDAFFVHALARVLPRFERFAFRYGQDELVPAGTTALGVAVDIDDDLFVVTLDEPGAKDVVRLSEEIRAAVVSLRAGELRHQQLRPAVMTVTNLGATGVESFAAIINPPEAAILAVGAIRPVVVPRGDGVAVESRVTLTLSVDHRVVNGKYAAEFLAALVAELESPES